MKQNPLPGAPPDASPPPDTDPPVVREASEQMKTISALATDSIEAVHGATHVNGLLRGATRHCRRLVDARQVRVWIARRGGRRLVARDFDETTDRMTAEHRIARNEGLVGWTVTHDEPLRITDGTPPAGLVGEPPSFTSAMVVPLRRRGDVFGAIECLDRRDGGVFAPADFDHLELAAEHIAFALDNALLFEETERRALEKEVLLEVGRTLSRPLELSEVIEAILRSLKQIVNYDAAAIYLKQGATESLEMVSEIGHPEGSDEAFRVQVGHGIVGWVAKTGEPVIVPDVRGDPRYVEARPTTRSELAAPLQVDDRTIGVFNLESDMVDAYHEGHLEIVHSFAAQAAAAIARAQLTRELLERRHLERELAIARDIQLSFLPKSDPVIPGFELAGTARPHDEVGGDYYDFIRITDTRLGIAIADVSGKGIPAALIMAGFRMSLLAEIRNEFAIRAVMRKVNGLLHESTDRDKFVTAFYGVLDHRNRVLIFSNAGHNPPILMRFADGRFEYLVDGGVAFGVLPEAHYEERPIALRPGDVMVLYTDGVSEAESPEGEQYGTLRIEQVLARSAGRTAREILDGLVGDVLAFAGARGQNDDLTAIVVRMLPLEPPGQQG